MSIKVNKQIKMKTNLKRQRGVGLIEVLIALLVLSIGLLGLASLQTHALRFGQGAFVRTQATTIAYDMLDRMRANRAHANTPGYAAAFGGVPTTAPTPVCETGNCTPTQMAAYDILEWKYALGQRLPGGDGTIVSTPVGTSRIYTITTRWESREGGTQVSLQVRSEI
jgi:type IV pilus assembly protein PilV